MIPKLSRAIGMLAKIRHYVPKQILLNIYHAIFATHLAYGSQIWGQCSNDLIKKLGVMQNKAMRIINFKSPRDSAINLYFDSNVLKHEDQIKMTNCSFAFSYLKNMHPSSFETFLTPVKNTHNHETKSIKLNFQVLRTNTVTYGTNSIKSKIISTWNNIYN